MKHKKIKSQVETGHVSQQELLSLIRKEKQGDIYVMADNEIYFGKLVSGEIKLYNGKQMEAAYIQEVRVFGETKELKITRVNDNFIWRLRKDSIGNDTIYFDDTHKLWGKVVSYDGEWSVLKENRGTKLVIPKVFKEKEDIVLVFRKYVAFQEWDLATNQPFRYAVVDERLVEFQEMKEEK